MKARISQVSSHSRASVHLIADAASSRVPADGAGAENDRVDDIGLQLETHAALTACIPVWLARPLPSSTADRRRSMVAREVSAALAGHRASRSPWGVVRRDAGKSNAQKSSPRYRRSVAGSMHRHRIAGSSVAGFQNAVDALQTADRE